MNGGAQAGGIKITEGMVDSMRSTRPWTKFLAVLGFVCVGFMILLGAGFVIFANVLPHQKNAPPAFFGVFYILFSVLYFMPSYYLYKYSSSIAHFLKSSAPMELESALSYQKSFWKFIGVLALIGLVLGILGMAAAVIIPIFMKFRVQQGV